MKLRDYQVKALKEIRQIMSRKQVCYLAGQLRTGKTITSLHVAQPYVQQEGDFVLFVTKKKVIPKIEEDYKKSGLDLSLVVTTYNSIHKVKKKPKFIIYDEAHMLGAYPKPSQRTKRARKQFAGIPALLLSGTPSPESYSQLYHQFWITGQGPFGRYKNFYQFAKVHVDITETFIGNGRKVKNYSKAKIGVAKAFEDYRVVMTQKAAGFDGKVIEKIHTLKLPDTCVKLISTLRKKRFSDRHLITADSAPKLMHSVHQISSGTYINDDRKRVCLSTFKAEYIKKNFKGRRIAIFYKYIAEGDMLREFFKYKTDDPELFAEYDNLPFICQISAGREGIDLRSADDLIFFNIDYSAVSYWQGIARSQSIDGGDKKIHWLFSDVGIEKHIYKIVRGKKKYTEEHFKDYERNWNQGKVLTLFEK